MQTAAAGTTPTLEPAGTTPTLNLEGAAAGLDPAAALRAELDRTAELRWKAVLDYRDRMQAQGRAVVFAQYGGEMDWHIRLACIPVGGELVMLGRRDENGRQRWDGLHGQATAARAGDVVLHAVGDDPIELWNVCGRFRRMATASHPNTPGELVHVLEQVEGSIR
jgi:hypothetical protein